MDKRDEIISLLKEQNKRLDAVQKLLVSLIACNIGTDAPDKWGKNALDKYIDNYG